MNKCSQAKNLTYFVDNNLFSLIESIHNDVVVLNGKGVIIWVSPSFEKTYGLNKEDIIGKTTFEMEQKKIFYPSVAALVLKNKRKTTILEHNKQGENLVVTGIPIFTENNEIKSIISYSFDLDEFLAIKSQYEKQEKLLNQYSSEIKKLREKDMNLPGIIAKSKQMEKVLSIVLKIASVDTNVLITGESGVGKNLIAHLIHKKSPRQKEPFIEINCGAIPLNLLESELFGYSPGAFTGAQKHGKIGLIELANKGTLFLDEIGELPLNLQVKILKVIQDKTLTPIGGTKSVKVDFRLITATNQDLKSLVQKKRFREDLFYRLNVVPINIPPLRDRKEDILPLILFFLEKMNKKYKKTKTLSSSTIDKLLAYNWPGNVRQLQNIIERIVVISDEDIISIENLPEYINNSSINKSIDNLSLKEALTVVEKEMVEKAYKQYKTTVGVAKSLSISQPTAVRKIKKYITE